MRHTNRNLLFVLALVGAAALSHPTAATAAACENGVDNADTCAAHVGGKPRSRRQSGPHVFAYGRLGSGIVFAERTHRAPAIGIGLRAELDTFAVDARTESGIQSPTGLDHRYVPSAVVFIGIGWQRHRR